MRYATSATTAALPKSAANHNGLIHCVIPDSDQLLEIEIVSHRGRRNVYVRAHVRERYVGRLVARIKEGHVELLPGFCKEEAFIRIARMLVERDQWPLWKARWVEGRCRMCNHRLTHPSSIESGIGPTCAKKRSTSAKYG